MLKARRGTAGAITAALLLLFASLVALRVHGFSLAAWHEVIDGSAPTEVLLGTPRLIRSDDWKVHLPLLLAQTAQAPRFPVVNPSVGLGQNMLLPLDALVAHWVALFRPTMWGFLLGPDAGIAWLWWSRVLGLFGVWFAVLTVVTRGRFAPAATGAALLACAPFFQFWAFNGAPQVTSMGAAFLATVALARARERHRRQHPERRRFADVEERSPRLRPERRAEVRIQKLCEVAFGTSREATARVHRVAHHGDRVARLAGECDDHRDHDDARRAERDCAQRDVVPQRQRVARVAQPADDERNVEPAERHLVRRIDRQREPGASGGKRECSGGDRARPSRTRERDRREERGAHADRLRRAVEGPELEERRTHEQRSTGRRGREPPACHHREHREPNAEESKHATPPKPGESRIGPEKEAPHRGAQQRDPMRDGRFDRHQHALPETDARIHQRKSRRLQGLRKQQRELHHPVVGADPTRLAEEHLAGRAAVDHLVPGREREAMHAQRDERGEEQQQRGERDTHRAPCFHGCG